MIRSIFCLFSSCAQIVPAKKLISNAPTQQPACKMETTSPLIFAISEALPTIPKYSGKVGMAKTPEMTPFLQKIITDNN